MPKSCPSETGGMIQNTAQTSSLLKDEEKDRVLQSNNYTSNPFDKLDSLLVKLNEGNNELSHNQEDGLVTSNSQVKASSEKDMKKDCDNNTPRKTKVTQKGLRQPTNRKPDECQITNHLLDPIATKPYLLNQYPEAKGLDQNRVLGNSRPHPSSLNHNHTLIPMNDKQKTGGKVLTNLPQNFGREEGQSNEHSVLGSGLADYRSTEKLQLDVPKNINPPHPSSHLEIPPSLQTDPSNEQQKQQKVEMRRKKRKKENKAGKFRKRKKEESFQMTVQTLLQNVEIMENIVQTLINWTRKSKT